MSKNEMIKPTITMELPNAPLSYDNADIVRHWHNVSHQCGAGMLEAASRAGEALIEQRDLCQPKQGGGEFTSWCRENLPFGRDMVYRYIKIAENWEKLSHACDNFDEPVSIRGALEMIDKANGKPPKAPSKPAPAPPAAGPEVHEPEDDRTIHEEEEAEAMPSVGSVPEVNSPTAEPAPAATPKETPAQRVKRLAAPIDAFVARLGRLKIEFRELCDENEATTAWIRDDATRPQDFERNLKNLQRVFSNAKPHAMCTYCDGAGCDNCRHTGVLPRHIAESAPDPKG